MIAALNVSFSYGQVPVLAGVDLSARGSNVVGLIGPNGSGKTTLLRLLYGSLSAEAGQVSVDDTPVASLKGRDMARRLAVVAQEAPSELPLKVREMVLLGRAPHRSPFAAYTSEDRQVAAAALVQVGARDLADRAFNQLSGGEKQRVLIARALAQQATHLLLDEPTNHLDVRYQHEILDLVASLDLTTVIVLHDLNLAARYCHRLILLHQGRVVASGPPDEVLTPELIEPVYCVSLRRLDDCGCVQLIFRRCAESSRSAAPLYPSFITQEDSNGRGTIQGAVPAPAP